VKLIVFQTKEILRISLNSTFHYPVHKNCHLSLSWARAIHSTPLFYVLKNHFNNILVSTPRFSKWSLSLRSLHQHSADVYDIQTPCCCGFPHVIRRINFTLHNDRILCFVPFMCKPKGSGGPQQMSVHPGPRCWHLTSTVHKIDIFAVEVGNPRSVMAGRRSLSVDTSECC